MQKRNTSKELKNAFTRPVLYLPDGTGTQIHLKTYRGLTVTKITQILGKFGVCPVLRADGAQYMLCYELRVQHGTPNVAATAMLQNDVYGKVILLSTEHVNMGYLIQTADNMARQFLADKENVGLKNAEWIAKQKKERLG